MLTIYGAAIVTLMMLFYAFESRSHWFTLAFAGACLGSALYGFLAGRDMALWHRREYLVAGGPAQVARHSSPPRRALVQAALARNPPGTIRRGHAPTVTRRGLSCQPCRIGPRSG